MTPPKVAMCNMHDGTRLIYRPGITGDRSAIAGIQVESLHGLLFLGGIEFGGLLESLLHHIERIHIVELF